MGPVVNLLALGIEGLELCAAWARSLVLPKSDTKVEEVECVNVGRHGAPKETRVR
jgi:hypothetical protein